MKPFFRSLMFFVGFALLTGAARAAWTPPETATIGSSSGTISATATAPSGFSPLVLYIWVKDPNGTWHVVATSQGVNNQPVLASGSYTFNNGGGTYVWYANYAMGGAPPTPPGGTIINGPSNTNIGTPITAATIAPLIYNGSPQSPSSASSTTPGLATVSVSAPAQTNANTYNTATVTGTGSYNGTLSNVPWTINKANAFTPTISASANPMTYGGSVTITPANGTTNLYAWLINGATVSNYNGSGWSVASGSYAGGNWTISGLNLVLTPTSTASFTVNFQDTGNGNYNAATSATLTETVNQAAQAAVTINSASSTTYGNTYTATATGGSGTGAYVWALGTGSTAAGAAINASTGVITANSTGTVAITAYRAGDANYSQSATTANFPITVSARPITVTLAGSKTYDGTTVATGATASITTGSLAAGDGIGYAYAATSSANAGTYPGLTTATITNAVAPTTRTGSYAITYTGNYTINGGASQAAVTINSASSTTYGNTYTATATGGSGTGAYVWALGTGSTAAGAAINASTGVITANSTGTVSIKVYRAGDTNYSQSATTADFPVSVGARPITVTLAGSKTYNGTTAATGATASITTGSLAAGDGIGYAYAATSSANAGTYPGLTTATVTNAAAPTTRTGSYTVTYAGNYTINGGASQAAVTINSASSTTYGNTYTATATGGSGTGAYVWALGTGSTAAGAAINASTGVITANSTGTVSIKVYRAGDTNYSQSATTADFPVSVGARPITVTLAGSKTYNGTTAATGATASITTGSLAAGDGIGYAYAATSSANTGTYSGLTTATVTNAAAPTTRTGSYAITYAGSYAINGGAAQAAVSISSSSSATYGTTYTATATGGTGTGAYVWALGTGSTAAGAAISSSTGVITANSSGAVYIKVYRAGDTNYSQSATTADFPVSVTARPITVTLAGSKTYDTTTAATGATASITTGSLGTGDTIAYAFAATSSANFGTYSSLTTATVSNTTAPTTRTSNYTITYAGSYAINKATVTAATITPLTYNGSPQSPTAAASTTPAGAAVTVSAPAQTAVNTYTTATVAGTGNYTGTLNNVSWAINKANQTINFPNPGTLTFGMPVTLSASATSGLTVALNVTAGSATLAGNVLTPTAMSTVTVTASQAGNANYNAATNVVQSPGVNKAVPATTFTSRTLTLPVGAATYFVTSFDLNALFAHPSNGSVTQPTGTITYTIAAGSPSGTVGSAVTAGTVLSLGTYYVQANYPGDGNYSATSGTATWTVVLSSAISSQLHLNNPNSPGQNDSGNATGLKVHRPQ